MLEIEDYAFPFGLCFSRPIMLKIMLAYCINAYTGALRIHVRRSKFTGFYHPVQSFSGSIWVASQNDLAQAPFGDTVAVGQ